MFSEPENTACFTCKHILEDKLPVLFVTHDGDDGSWQFLCGANRHEDSDARIVGLKEMVEIDESLNALYEMPTGVGAEREASGMAWKPFR